MRRRWIFRGATWGSMAVAACVLSGGMFISPPVAVDDQAVTAADTAVIVPVLANDSDLQGIPLHVGAVSQPASGLAVANLDGTITYAPASGFVGTDSFQYYVVNEAGLASSLPATVMVTVTPPPLIIVVPPVLPQGFITGGGWIKSPVGAVATKRKASDKGQFSFTCKYVEQEDETDPTVTEMVLAGHVNFHLQAIKLKFHSTELDALVIDGKTAWVAGFGKVNGADGYAFILAVADGVKVKKTRADLFRLKIWPESGAVVYDEPGDPDDAPADQPITQGSIVIHQPKP